MITIEWLQSLPCCYSTERLVKLFKGRESLTPLEVLKLPIPVDDKLWVVARHEFIPEHMLHFLACRFVRGYKKELKEKRDWIRAGYPGSLWLRSRDPILYALGFPDGRRCLRLVAEVCNKNRVLKIMKDYYA